MRLLLFFGALGLFFTATYNLFIECGVSKTAQPVEISQLEADPPWNRHLIVINAKPVLSGALKCWKRKGSVIYSEEYYIPIKHVSLIGIDSLPPRILLRTSKERLDQIRQSGFDPNGIRGIRLTKWDMTSKLKVLLQQTYGERAAKKILVVDAERSPTGLLVPFCEAVGAICFAIVLVFPWKRIRTEGAKNAS